MSRPYVVAITGASGAAYAKRLLQVLVQLEHRVHLTISPAAAHVIRHELGAAIDLDRFELRQFVPALASSTVVYHHYKNFLAPIASGSHLTAGMVVCPCSGGTLSGIARGASGNLIERAAEVHLKERRPLILVPRETPLSLGYIDNMRAAALAGAVVLPAMPAWYHGAETLENLIDFIVARILDQLNIQHDLIRRWGENGVG